MWKLLTGMIAEEINNYLEQKKFFHKDGQKERNQRKLWNKGSTVD